MNIKNFIKKLFKKDTSNIRFLVKKYGIDILDISESKWYYLDSLVKYLTKNELNIESININLITKEGN